MHDIDSRFPTRYSTRELVPDMGTPVFRWYQSRLVRFQCIVVNGIDPAERSMV